LDELRFSIGKRTCNWKQSTTHPDKEKTTWTYLQHAIHATNEEEGDKKKPEKVANKTPNTREHREKQGNEFVCQRHYCQ
jgi:hypothetical protein